MSPSVDAVLTPRIPIEEILQSSSRFELRRCLGAGGMGVVYEVYDTQRDAPVALKTLRRISPSALFLFKREFRALADVTHRNLVTLYELLTIDDQWFFTMELLEGADVLSFLRGAPACDDEALETATAAPDETLPTQESLFGGATTTDRPAPPVAGEVIRPVLVQLVRGLRALHVAGHLHCDIKPSNVMVTEDDRVVVLDYGVMTTVTGSRSHDSTPDGKSGSESGSFRGTPTYASPEQAAGESPTSASDWYSVGVMVYEALTGHRPFAGSAESVMAAKRTVDPPTAIERHPGADPVLAELCTRLLARDPAARPGGAEILRVLGAGGDERAPRRRRPSVAPIEDTVALVGRARQLARLREAFDHSRQGAGGAVCVEGRSGMGKTSLVNQFLDDLAGADQALVLTGRCYERESVPHQAVDGLVDSLCRFLLELPREQADLLMPLDVQAMARAFPVLERVGAVAQARRRSAMTAVDPVELRRRAYQALRELFARIAEQQPLVLFIDDLQWGDVDSAPFLADLLQPPVPPLLLIVTYRSEEVDASPLLRTLLSSDHGGSAALAATPRLAVGSLTLAEARSLAESLLAVAGAARETAEPIARESGGNPFFVHELVRHVAASTAASPQVPPLGDVLLARAAALSDDARDLLRVVAVAGKPLPAGVARRAAGIGANHPRAIAELRTARLIRTSGGDDDLTIETYHDRVRETIANDLEPDALAATHLGVADALVAAAITDPEALAIHYAGAGESAAAAEYAALAGDKASAALAFDRAATYYELALEHSDANDRALAASLGRRLGEALVSAGRGADSPRVFLAAAEVADPAEARDLQVSAGSELLRSGRVEDGIEVLRPPLESAGISLARSKTAAALSLLARRAYARLRGLGFERRSAREVAPQTLTEIDACHAAAAGLAMVDPVRGAYVQSRHLMAALKTGDAFRVGRALTYEGGFLCIAGKPARARVDRILRTVGVLASELDEPYLEALHHTHRSLAEYQCGAWSAALEHAEIADATLRGNCIGSSWERSSVQLYGLWSLFWLGELRELADRTRASVREAHERGDLYAIVSLNIGLPAFAGLVTGDVDGTRRRVRAAADRWAHNDYHLQHYWTEMALAMCELYEGDALAAFERIDGERAKLRRAFLLRVVMLRAENTHLAGRCALAAARFTDEPRRLLAVAERRARKLAREPMPWCAPAAQLIRAGVAHARGRRDAAIELLDRGERGLRAADTHALAHAASYQRGIVVGGDEGAERVEAAAAWMRGQAVADVPAMMDFFVPGFAGSDRRRLAAATESEPAAG